MNGSLNLAAKAVNRDELAQQCVASLEDAEDPEIDEPEEFKAGGIVKGASSQFGAKLGCKKREWSQELQFEKTVQAKPAPSTRN